MKCIIPILTAGLLLLPVATPAADAVPAAKAGAPAAAQSEVTNELDSIVKKIREKLEQNKSSEADLADNLKEFDALLAKHKGEKTEDVVQVLYMKASLYDQVLKNPAKAGEIKAQIKKDYPDSRIAKNLKAQEASDKIREALVPGAQFPDFEEKDLNGKPLSIAAYKGKVVLVDFWATWCGPCVGELPNVLKAYEAYHSKGFEIVGISLDQDENKLRTFIEKQKMPWQQYFDGKGWQNKLAGKYGVNSIPATYLLDTEGKIIDSNLRGEALDKAVAKALEKKS